MSKIDNAYDVSDTRQESVFRWYKSSVLSPPKLQQLFTVTYYRCGEITNQVEEWRDVPTVTEGEG